MFIKFIEVVPGGGKSMEDRRVLPVLGRTRDVSSARPRSAALHDDHRKTCQVRIPDDKEF